MAQDKFNILVYGGTFDPPHLGHKAVVCEVLKRYKVSKLLVMPAPFPAGADGNHKDPTLPFKTRLKLCNQLFDDWFPTVEVSKLEERLEAPQFTLKTVVALKEQYPDKSLGLIIGSDQFKLLPKWRNPVEIVGICDLVVVQRDGDDLPALASEVFKELGLELMWTSNIRADVKGYSSRLHVIKEGVSDASSTEIRGRLDRSEGIPEEWMLGETVQYLRNKKEKSR